MTALEMCVCLTRSLMMYWNMSEGDLTWMRYFSWDSVNDSHSVMSSSSPMVDVTLGSPRLSERDFMTSLVSPPKVRSSTRSGGVPPSIMESSSLQTEQEKVF